MARRTEYIADIYEPLSEGDGIGADAIVGVIPAANLPPPPVIPQTSLPDDLQHLEREIAFDHTAINTAWRLGSDAPDITLANTYRFLHDVLATNTSVPNEITQGTAITAAASAPSTLTLNPPTFVPGGNTNTLTITQPNATAQSVLAFNLIYLSVLFQGNRYLKLKKRALLILALL